jgi:hypothetical protein
MKFRPMPKTPRLSREIVISEKIDGTNASVYIPPPEEAHLFAPKKEKPPKAPRDPSKGGRRLIQHRIDFPDRRRA